MQCDKFSHKCHFNHSLWMIFVGYKSFSAVIMKMTPCSLVKLPMFRRNVLPLFSGWKSMSGKHQLYRKILFSIYRCFYVSILLTSLPLVCQLSSWNLQSCYQKFRKQDVHPLFISSETESVKYIFITPFALK